MKKTKVIHLVLITALLASCDKSPKSHENDKKVFMRSDTTAKYTHVHHNSGLLWFYAFRPYGMFYGGSYHHGGFYSSAISQQSNVGTSTFKSSIVKGGFGGTHHYSVSS